MRMIPGECDSLQVNMLEFLFSLSFFWEKKTRRILEIRIALELNLELKLEKQKNYFLVTWFCPFGDSDLRSAILFNLSQEYSGKWKKELAFGAAQVASEKGMKSLKSCSLRAVSWLYHFMSVWHWCSPLWNSVYCFVEWEWGFQFYGAIVHVKWGNGYKTLNTLPSTETKSVQQI